MNCFTNTKYQQRECGDTYNKILDHAINNQQQIDISNKNIFPELQDANKQNFPNNINLTYISEDGIQFAASYQTDDLTNKLLSNIDYTKCKSILYKRNNDNDFWKKVFEFSGVCIKLMSGCSLPSDTEKGRCMFILLHDQNLNTYLTRISNDYGVTWSNIQIKDDPTTVGNYGTTSYSVTNNLIFRIDLNQDKNNINFYQYNLITNKIERNFIINLDTDLKQKYLKGFYILSFDATLNADNTYSIIISFDDAESPLCSKVDNNYTCAYYSFNLNPDLNSTPNPNSSNLSNLTNPQNIKLENKIEDIIPDENCFYRYCQSQLLLFPLNFLNKISDDGNIIITSKLRKNIGDPYSNYNALTLAAVLKNNPAPQSIINFYNDAKLDSIYNIFFFTNIVIDNDNIYFNTYHQSGYFKDTSIQPLATIPPTIDKYKINIVCNKSFYVRNNKILTYDFIDYSNIQLSNNFSNTFSNTFSMSNTDTCNNITFLNSDPVKNINQLNYTILKGDNKCPWDATTCKKLGPSAQCIIDYNTKKQDFLKLDATEVNNYLENRQGLLRFYEDGTFVIFNILSTQLENNTIFTSYNYNKEDARIYNYRDYTTVLNFNSPLGKPDCKNALNFNSSNNFLFFKDENNKLIVLINIFDTLLFADYCTSSGNKDKCYTAYLNYCGSIKKCSQYNTYPKYYRDTDIRCACIDKESYIENNFKGLSDQQKATVENSYLPCISAECAGLEADIADQGTFPIKYRNDKCDGKTLIICNMDTEIKGKSEINSESWKMIQNCGTGPGPIETDCSNDSSKCPTGYHCDKTIKKCVEDDVSRTTDIPTPPKKTNVILIIIIVIIILIILCLAVYFLFFYKNKIIKSKRKTK